MILNVMHCNHQAFHLNGEKMEYLKINYDELSALNGLPHLQQLLYLRGIKPFVDYRTNLVGLKRGISYQSLAEALYVEPHPGIKSGSPSKDQIRRAIKGLEKAGLLRIQSLEWRLVFQCLLINQPSSNQNKAALNKHEDLAINANTRTTVESGCIDASPLKATTTQTSQPAIPHYSNKNNYVCVNAQFEKFWTLYPKKSAKLRTWDAFQKLLLTEALFEDIMSALQAQLHAVETAQSQGQWVPKWKLPVNWLLQRCWEDEIELNQERPYANHGTHSTPKKPVDSFWEACKSGAQYPSFAHQEAASC